MLIDLEIIPIGTQNTSLSAVLGDVARIIHDSGLDYRVGSMGTVIEGDWDRVMAVVKTCHEAVLGASARVMTTIRIDERTDKSGPGRILSKVQSLQARSGRILKT